ncbi:MAG: TolC family protein [Armatimonadota bacterium]
MRYGRGILYSTLFLLAVSLASADEPVMPALSEAQAVTLALQQNPLIRAAHADAQAAQARVGMAKSETALQVTGTGVIAGSNMAGTLGVPGLMTGTTSRVPGESGVQVGAMALYPLSTGGRLQATVLAAQRQQTAAAAQVTVTRISVARDARIRYAEWVEHLAMQRVAEDELHAQAESTRVAQQLFDVGKIPKFDLLRSQAALANAQQRVTNTKAEVTVAKANLATVLATPTTAFTTPEHDLPLGVPPANALETALATRPEMKAAQSLIEAAQATVRARQAQYRPQVYAFGMVGGGAPGEMNRSVGISAGVMAGLPLVDGGRRRAEVQEAEQDVQRSQALRESVELQVRAEVTAAEARVDAARQNIDTATQQVTAAQESYAVAQARYQAGKSIVVELLDALQARTQAQQSLVAAQSQYRIALADLYRATGLETITPSTEG